MELDKKKLIETLLEKRFGTKDPDEIDTLLEINVFESVCGEENFLGIGVELIIEDNDTSRKEEYQISTEGIVYSWGNTPVIDKRSQKQSLNLEELPAKKFNNPAD